MTRRDDSNRAAQIERRLFLAGVVSGALGGLAGCSGTDETASTGDEDEDSTTTDSPDTQATPESEDTTSTATESPATQATATFDHPAEVQRDDPFEMTITGLPSSTSVQLRQGDPGDPEAAVATVRTDENGRVELKDATVVGGDIPADLDVPLSVSLIQFSDTLSQSGETQTVSYSVSADGTELGSTEVNRQLPPTEPDRQLERDDFVGGLFEPVDSDQGLPVIVLHGPEGSPQYREAGQLAQNGFTALALHYFDGPGLPDNLGRVPIEYVERAAAWLLDHEATRGEQVGLLGYSKGGEMALLAGSQFDTVGSVVSVAGSGLTWMGSSREVFQVSSWTLDGEPVYYVSAADSGWTGTSIEGYRNSYQQATEEEIEAATIPVENIDGPVLLLSGSKDKLWNAERYHTIAENRLREAGHPAFEHRVYEDAGHAIVEPYRSVRGFDFDYYGGTVAGTAYASHDHWPRVLETLSALD